jgi:hypothetical protein
MKASVSIALILAGVSAPAIAQPTARGWISKAGLPAASNPVVLHFRRTIDLAERPHRYPVRVTADNRFILYVNGTRLAAGPSTGDVAHWRETALDLAPYLKRGRNVVAAVIWNGVKPLNLPSNPTAQQVKNAEGAALFSQTAPNFQQSVATGFRLIGDGDAAVLSTDHPGWRVHRDIGHGFENGWRQVVKGGWFYVAGHPETIDAAKADFDWTGPLERGAGWEDAVPAPEASRRTIVADKLPPQAYAATPFGKVVRTDLPGGERFPQIAVTVPANTSVKLLIQREAMVSAYPELDVSGGAGSTIRLTWSEALYDANRKKGDRALIGDRNVFGIHDTFLPDGQQRTLAPLWWRTWRYAEIAVETKDQPLVLKGLRAFESGYPFRQVGRFTSDDPTLSRIFDVGWRTARLDAHETYMDTAYWEQLQYTGDTRLQMLISYAVAGDPRLAEQAIDAYPGSNVENGLMDGAYPQRSSNPIAPFSLIWVAMLDDWRMRQPDTAPILRHLDRMRQVLDWFQPWQQPSGLLGKNPQWNFIDWVGQSATDRTNFPSYGSTNESCLMSVIWLGALQQGARIEADLGDKARGAADAAKAEIVKQAIRKRCWAPSRGLFADNPDGTVFSQHMNALAILYDVASPDEANAILTKIVAPGRGIDAPAGMYTTSYYFAWYLAQAFVHAGKGDQYLKLLDTWRALLKLNYTTWPEERGDTRSDSHAWSAHPTADLLGIVAGIGPGDAGYKSLRVAPAIGDLKRVDATAATPAGPVRVRYRVIGNKLAAEIDRPASLPGTFEWGGRRYALGKPITRLTLPLR